MIDRRNRVRLSVLGFAAILFLTALGPLSATGRSVGEEVPGGGCQSYGSAIEPNVFLCRCNLEFLLMECPAYDPEPSPACVTTYPNICRISS
jgi:hypothetical protein